MATVKQTISEHDIVVLRERVGDWPAGTKGTAVSIYDDAALVEIADEHGRTLELIQVPARSLEIQRR